LFVENRRKLAKITWQNGQNLAKIAENWRKSPENWQKSLKLGKNGPKLAKITENWRK
jgi:hypothetical protein